MQIDLKILPTNQQALLNILRNTSWISDYYLAGGTGLALQYKHRKSVDFDFFCRNDFVNEEIINKLRNIGKVQLQSEAKNTLHALVNDIRVSFLGYKYPLLKEPITLENIKIADHLDIACMKLSAIVSRGTKKDFIDLFYLLKSFTLEELFQYYSQKYPVEDYRYILLKSLVYFEDAEQDPMPVVYEAVRWKDVKSTIIEIVRKTGRV
jgi:hypothetical protein